MKSKNMAAIIRYYMSALCVTAVAHADSGVKKGEELKLDTKKARSSSNITKMSCYFLGMFTLLASCSQHAISTKASATPTKVQVGQRVVVSVSATNRSGRTIVAPPFLDYGTQTMMDQSGIVFRHSGKPSDSGSINRFSVHSSPPSFDNIAPGGARAYRFYWTAEERHIGQGRLEVRLPHDFRPPSPIPIIVEGVGSGEKSSALAKD